MAWPLGRGGRKGSRNADADAQDDISIRRLEAMSNVGYEEVPLPDEGELSEEEAWTISPTSAVVRIGSQMVGDSSGKSSSAASPSPVQSVSATVDTKALERLLSSRLDMVEDTMRSMSFQIQNAITSMPESSESSEDEGDADGEEADGDGELEAGVIASGMDVSVGEVPDRVITATGQIIQPSATGSNRMAANDAASLLELYEAQALNLNPFLAAPEGLEEVTKSIDVGPHMLAALLLDNMTTKNQMDVASAWSNYQSNKSLLNSVRAQVNAAEIANEGIVAEYNSGSDRTTLEVIQSNSLLLNAQISLADSERNYILSQFNLLKSVGLLNSDYLKIR